MRRNVTIGFSPQEFLRLHGAAAVAQMPVSSYVKWLLRGSPDGVNGNMSVILSRLDEIFVAIARLSSAPGAPAVMPLRAHSTAPRELIEEKLRARGLPSITIRQVSAVLDELEAGR
jgi:hypothetical protein